MKELVILSGKGGTGKTSITAAIACLAENKVMADCDVDAADLHLVLSPVIEHRQEFFSGKNARINLQKCTKCGKCIDLCRFNAISKDYKIDSIRCEGCGVCNYFCPENAVIFTDKKAGEHYSSSTQYGPMIHARLGIAESNSGKLVSMVRREAVKKAVEENFDHVIIDGSPGIGCPVIASITGASLVLVVTEPTVSGIHDMKRVFELAQHFKVKIVLCINKFDLNMENTELIKKFCTENKIKIAGMIPFDNDFTKAQLDGKSIIEYSSNPASREIKKMWEIIRNELN